MRSIEIKSWSYLYYALLYLPAHHTLGKRAKTTIVRLFDVVRETAGGQLLHMLMILETLTACSLAGTRLIGAITFLQVFWFIVFHSVPSFTISSMRHLRKSPQ
jgi:hypothetical protein